MDKQFRYEQIASKIENIIFNQQLRPGDKVPSVRNVSKELGVSPATVAQAYSLLDAKGILTPRPKSGYYVGSGRNNRLSPATNQRLVQLPEKVQVNTMATAMIKNTRKYGVVNFSSLAPAQELMPIARLHKALFNASKEALNDHYVYPFLEGAPRLQQQIALHSIDWDLPMTQETILVTNGCMEAISLCLDAVTRPGDIVAVECPTYAGILQCLENRGLRALGIRVDPELGLDVDYLEQAMEKNHIAAAIFSPACHNPLGCAMPEDQKLRLVELLSSANIPFIEDDALGELHFRSPRPLPAKAYDETGNIMYCSSFSKTLTPGFRIGWVSGGKRHAILETTKFATNISTNTILQDAIGRYLETGNYHVHLKKLRAAIQEQVFRYRTAISLYFPEGTRISSPQGGYSLWIELPEQIKALQLQKEALKKGIGFCPGNIFSMSSDFYHFIRINCGPLFNPKIDQALAHLGSLVHQLAESAGRGALQTA